MPTATLIVITISVRRMTSCLEGQTTFLSSSAVCCKNVTGEVIIKFSYRFSVVSSQSRVHQYSVCLSDKQKTGKQISENRKLRTDN